MEAESRKQDQAGVQRSAEGFKAQLAAKVEALAARSLKDNMKTRDYHKGIQKCSQCGKSFHGKGGAGTCSDACRKAKSRG